MSGAKDDPRLNEARALPIEEVADRLGLADLKRAGRERVGPCPVCGGNDRFSISLDKNVFNCRHCGGGDAIALVELVQGCDFRAALDWLVGDVEISLDPAEARRRAEKAEKARADRERQAEAARKQAIAAARAIWAECRAAEGTPVRDYLALRGIRPDWLSAMPRAIRFHPDLRYTVFEAGAWKTIHSGPAMVAGVAAPAGDLIGVHRTWIDLAQDSGKAAIVHAGEPQNAKKILGSKKGGAIRLSGDRQSDVLVMGEGIETTLSAMVSQPIASADYWCGVDLGNMAGRRLPVRNPDTGKSSTRFSDAPDMADDTAFLPPPWCRHLVYIEDGDSAPRETRAKLTAGLNRARRHCPGLRASIVRSGDGVDLNDVIGQGRAA